MRTSRQCKNSHLLRLVSGRSLTFRLTFPEIPPTTPLTRRFGPPVVLLTPATAFLIGPPLVLPLPRAAPRPAKRSRAAASEQRPAARRPSRARHSAPQSLSRDSCLPVPRVPPTPGSGRSRSLRVWRVCRGTPLFSRPAACAVARPLQVGSGATWRRAGRAAGGRGDVRSPGSGLAAMRAPGRAGGASGGFRSCA